MARSVYSFLVASSKRQPVLKAQNPINPELSNRRKRNVGCLIPPFAHQRDATISLNQCILLNYANSIMQIT